jgi:hypothetical protein
MRLMQPRGPVSERVFAHMLRGLGEGTVDIPAQMRADASALTDDDLQIALWALYELHYRGFADVEDRMEWDPQLIAVRARLESVFEQAVRDLVGPSVARAEEQDGFQAALEAVIADVEGPSLAVYLQQEATEDQYLEFLTLRSIYHLKESDPHAFVLPRLTGRAKVALAELQYDEFGAGRPDRLHHELFSRTLRGAGLDDEYGAYIELIPASTLAANNVMSLFGLHRRLRGAAMGHLAAFETTSSLPCRKYAQGGDRLGFSSEVTQYFDEHVEADAVHEHVAQRNICGAMVAEEPELANDVLVGAAACVQVGGLDGQHMLEAWGAGGSALRKSDEVAA